MVGVGYLERVRLELLQSSDEARILVLAVIFVHDVVGRTVRDAVDCISVASIETFVPFQCNRVESGLDLLSNWFQKDI